jgi:hypothetical protein
MAFSISQTQSVLWDQIEYSGSPSDFAWVLPVHAGAKIELSHDEFFAALDAMTTPTITGPQPSCGGGGGGVGCGFSSGNAALAGGDGPNNNVQVLGQSVVGPYDTVTVHSTNPTALYDWLVANGYDIPSSTRPVIDAYVAEGSDFIALRLAPGQGVQAMKPVRVVTPGAGLALPLRMVAAGVGANVGITLYVIGEGRYEAAPGFSNGVVDDSKLLWNAPTSQSNYQTLAAQIMQGSGGRTWLTEFAQSVSLQWSPSTFGPQNGNSYPCASAGPYGVTYYGVGTPSLAALYFSQCLCATALCGQTLVAPLGPDDASLDALLEGAASDSSSTGDDSAVDALAESAADDAAGSDAQGEEAAAGDAGDGDGSSIAPEAGCAARCDGFDDLDVASTGLDPNNIWVTRMRAQVPSNVLTEGDLVLQASASQSPVSSQHFATVYDDPTYNPCPNNNGGCATADSPIVVPGRVLVAGAFTFLGATLLRRRRPRAAR